MAWAEEQSWFGLEDSVIEAEEEQQNLLENQLCHYLSKITVVCVLVKSTIDSRSYFLRHCHLKQIVWYWHCNVFFNSRLRLPSCCYFLHP